MPVKKLFLVVVSVERRVILVTSLLGSKATGFLLSKSDGPFLKMNQMKFLSCIHEMIRLDKMNKHESRELHEVMLEILLERLSQKYGKLKRGTGY